MCIGSIISTETGRFGTYRSDDGNLELPISNITGDSKSPIRATIGEVGTLFLDKWTEDGYRFGHVNIAGVKVGIRAMIKQSAAGNKYVMFHGPWSQNSCGKAVDTDL
jgi:hypothetical protein